MKDGARKKGEWSELNTDRDGGNGHPQRLPQLAEYFAPIILEGPVHRLCRRTVLKNPTRMLCHFNNSLLGT